MPVCEERRDPDCWKRRRAWRRHYEAKGCNERKACDLACKKVQRKNTWPPGWAA